MKAHNACAAQGFPLCQKLLRYTPSFVSVCCDDVAPWHAPVVCMPDHKPPDAVMQPELQFDWEPKSSPPLELDAQPLPHPQSSGQVRSRQYSRSRQDCAGDVLTAKAQSNMQLLEAERARKAMRPSRSKTSGGIATVCRWLRRWATCHGPGCWATLCDFVHLVNLVRVYGNRDISNHKGQVCWIPHSRIRSQHIHTHPYTSMHIHTRP